MANTYFTTKLPANHEILSKPQAVLLKRLRASALLTPKHAVVGNVQAFREQCAALVWLESDVYSLAAVKQLPPTSRIVLCTMLGIPTTPVAVQAQAGRICQHVTSKSAAPIADGAAPPPYVAPIAAPIAEAAGAAAAPDGHGVPPPPAAPQPLPAQPPPVADALIGAPAPLLAGQAPPAIVDGNAAGIGMGAADSSDVIYIPRLNLVHSLVTPSQKRIVAELPWRNVREAVQASGIPTSAADDDWAVRDKLLIAVWAAETLRTSAHVRALASDVQHCVLAALGAEPTWAPPLQDAYTDSVLRLCKACPWAFDPSLSQGLLSTGLRPASTPWLSCNRTQYPPWNKKQSRGFSPSSRSKRCAISRRYSATWGARFGMYLGPVRSGKSFQVTAVRVEAAERVV